MIAHTIHESVGDVRLVRFDATTSSFQVFCLVGAPSPEVSAMLQALYSRNPASIATRIEALTPEGAQKFMDRFYLNYGHNSIADCGNVTLFFEGVPMHVAKAIQSHALYNGQEASTRYMDFSTNDALNTSGNPRVSEIQAAWLAFYRGSQERLKEHLREQFPLQENEDPKVYERAINARTFDVLRSFLPDGMPTNVSWTVSLRVARDHLSMLTQHPDLDVRTVAQQALDGLAELFPGSFGKRVSDEKLAEYQQILALIPSLTDAHRSIGNDIQATNAVAMNAMSTEVREWFKRRPPFVIVPDVFKMLGDVSVRMLLDYGSFRDIQRHRAVAIPVPVLDVDLGFETWYLDQLPADLRAQAEVLIQSQTTAIQAINNRYERQLATAMGFRVPVVITGGLPGTIYYVELRSRTDVHPTLREKIRVVGQKLREQLPDIALQVDDNTDDFSRRRGTSTIIDKATGNAVSD